VVVVVVVDGWAGEINGGQRIRETSAPRTQQVPSPTDKTNKAQQARLIIPSGRTVCAQQTCGFAARAVIPARHAASSLASAAAFATAAASAAPAASAVATAAAVAGCAAAAAPAVSFSGSGSSAGAAGAGPRPRGVPMWSTTTRRAGMDAKTDAQRPS